MRKWRGLQPRAMAEEPTAHASGAAPVLSDDDAGSDTAGGYYESLHAAAYRGDVRAVQQLLAAGADVDVRDSEGSLPLHEAAAAGHVAVAQLLLESGAAVDARDAQQRTPLHAAVRPGHVAVADALLRGGAALSARDVHGSSPFGEAVLFQQLELTNRFLHAAGADARALMAADSALYFAVLLGNAPLAELLLAHGADVVHRRGAQHAWVGAFRE
jgi:ankyrin repeat protein